MRDAQKTVVVIEDNPTDVFLIEEALRLQNLDVNLRVVEDGEEALRLIDKADQGENHSCPTLVLLDLNLPRTDGFQVLERIRSSKRCSHVPVVIMTSSAAATDRARSASLGATAYFRKPSQYDEFLQIGEIVKKHLR